MEKEKIRLATLNEAVDITGKPEDVSILVKGWRVYLERVGTGNTVQLCVLGGRGGLKARLWVSLDQLKQAVVDLQE